MIQRIFSIDIELGKNILQCIDESIFLPTSSKLPYLANENELLEISFQVEDINELKYISVLLSGQAEPVLESMMQANKCISVYSIISKCEVGVCVMIFVFELVQ